VHPAFDDLERRAVDKALTTTRAVRLRLDLGRGVPDDLVLECIDIAEQAPCGAAQPSRRWLVVRDPELRNRIGEWYRGAIHPAMRSEFGWAVPGDADFVPGGPVGDGQAERVFRSALHLAANLERVPVLVLCAIYGEHDQVGSPGLFDSVIQAGWSFCLAARARGLGSTWTTAHLGHAADVAALLGIPAGVTQVALFPVAWTIGTEFRPAQRPRGRDITFFDHWGLSEPASTVTLETDIAAPPASVWPHLVAACERAGRLTESHEPETCSWSAGGRTGRFQARPRIYGGTRLGCTVRFAAGAVTPSVMLEVREQLRGTLAVIKTDSE
jgi:nitroreductase